MLTEQLTRSLVVVEIAHPTADEWEVHLATSGVCVGFVTRLRSVFECVDVLPPYDVCLCGDLEGGLRQICATLCEGNAAILAAYGVG